MGATWPNHDAVWREWRAAMAGARMHHAWLLAGKEGLGKRDFAIAAGRELIAEVGISQPSEHPDLQLLTHLPKDDKETRKRDEGKPFQTKRNISVEQIRIMQRSLTTRPTLGSRRAIIIDPADDMEKSASNALLKSLEEPPQGTFFLLVAHRPSRLLPTIRSRCRILRFTQLDGAQLSQMLEHDALSVDPSVLDTATGSYGAAIRFIEEDLGVVARQIDRILAGEDTSMAAKGEFARLIGPRADRGRIQAILELAQSKVAAWARTSKDSSQRIKLIDAHTRLVALAAETPTYNFDTGLVGLEIGTLLVDASAASEHAHGAH